MHGDAN
jgi:hypothetical protein